MYIGTVYMSCTLVYGNAVYMCCTFVHGYAVRMCSTFVYGYTVYMCSKFVDLVILAYLSIRHHDFRSLFIRYLVATFYKHASHHDVWTLQNLHYCWQFISKDKFKLCFLVENGWAIKLLVISLNFFVVSITSISLQGIYT